MNPRQLSTQLLDGQQWSKDLKWMITLQADYRGNVTHASCTAIYGHGESALTGHAFATVAPFDTLTDVVRVLMIDAASNCAEQLTLFRD